MTLLKFISAIIAMVILFSFMSPSPDWYKYEDKNCAILFPKAPKNDTIVKETSIGKVTFYLHILKNGHAEEDSNTVYELLRMDYASNSLMNPTKKVTESLFDGVISSSLKQVNGKLLSEKNIAVNDYPGKEIRISFDKETKLITMRCYLAKAKVYTVEIVAPADKEINSNATTFFESFKIK